ncbi:hypothetical protein D0Z07_9192 [Hyphodiscus hymeniophilus]|uniref:Uncharacterized protein n=1 Tax=Hyphodiscus hymeniophilus TaxID=353542 RepID=A0A9P6VDR9_9HELO|nr:hypothetical protein D0Z07_9192 [Hyphodiscus hymeniophilus]
MTAVQIHNTTEAKQVVRDALNLLDAVSAYSINHQLPSDQLFDIDVRKRLQSLHSPKLPSPIHPLLEESNGFTKEEKKTLSPYCYKIENLAADFDDVLDGLEAYYKLMHAQNLTSKGELIDTIIRGGISKATRSVAKILDVVDSLALWHIREVEARALATERGHNLVSQEDKSNAATEMWQYLSSYNSDADRAKLDTRIFAGIRWNRFLDGKDVGMIVAVYPLPHSLKSHFVKLAPIVMDMPGILDRAKKATPCVQKLLDSRLRPWTGSKKRELPVQSVPEPGLKRRRPGTEAESGTPGGSSNSIGALLNAAEHIAAATQGQQLPSVRSSSTQDRMDSSSPESLVPEEIHLLAGEEVQATAGGQPEIWSNRAGSTSLEPQAEALDHHRERRRVDSSPSLDSSLSQQSVGPGYRQGGVTEETSLDGGKAQVVSGMKIAIMAEVDQLERFLGGYIFEGIYTSCMRHQEKERRCMRFTDTARLHVAYREGEDIKLEIWLCGSIGNDILQATMSSAEDLRNVLGGYLFEAMNTSNWRKEQERKKTHDFSGAVNITFPDEHNGSDCKMEVLLGSEMGLDLYKNAFPVL